MVYNRFLSNSALYNAGREEVAGIATSIIQAHTGPHIQAVVGSDTGVSFISDFVITEGTVKKPPTQFKFPDLASAIRAFQTQAPREDNLSIELIAAFIKGIAFKDLPAAIYPSNRIPDLSAIIFALGEANLLAQIVGELGTYDLPAIIQATVADLIGQILGVIAPSLRARIFVQAPKNLGAMIHTPLDLPAIIIGNAARDLPAQIGVVEFANLSGRMLGILAPNLVATIRSLVASTLDLPSRTTPLAIGTPLTAFINPSIPGPNDIVGIITAGGSQGSVRAAISSLVTSAGDLGAFLNTRDEFDLQAILEILQADNLKAAIDTIPVGERDTFFNAFLQPVNPFDLTATMLINDNFKFLGASILALHDTADLAALIKVSETFITSILTVSTLASRTLRATIGNPTCAGGSAVYSLSASVVAKNRRDLRASIESFINKNLGACINTQDIFFALDSVGFLFSPSVIRNTNFKAIDSIPISFSPFRGQNLGAIITAGLANVSLRASINATFPLPKVVPAVNVLTAADLRMGEDLNLQEIRLQLEGNLLEYIYVNGTEQAFTQDGNENWKINIRSFRTIAEGLFGDRAAGNICRLGSLTSFATIDQAVRFCIQTVLGFGEENNLGATIQSAGESINLAATLSISNTFSHMPALVGRVFPYNLGASVSSATEGILQVFISGGGFAPGSGTQNMLASIQQVSDLGLIGTISGSGQVGQLGAAIDITSVEGLGAVIASEVNNQSVLFEGTNQYITTASLNGLGFGTNARQFSVSFWVKWDTSADPTPSPDLTSPIPTVLDTILGATADANWLDGFGFYWGEDGTDINFFVNNFNSNSVPATISDFSQWTHIAGTYDADVPVGGIKVYVGGALTASGNHTSDVTGLSNLLSLGRFSASDVADSYPTQFIDEVGLWTGVALSGSEIFDIAASGVHNLTVNKDTYTHASDLTLYYQFENTDSTFPVVDNVVSSGTFDGTMFNMDTSNIVQDTP